ncbi:MAG: cytochrome c1 [Azoarcus sp.]|jgi:ubiquinol-cytochrome c reductase cytochrome c1 subunit|nr:cytochrome c1 [Azoarcus sp.]
MKTHAIKFLKRFAGVVLFVPALAMAAAAIHLDKAPVSTDQQRLQNGARTFVKYCLNCHSASLVRYNQLEKIGFKKEKIEEELIFSGENAGSMMTVAMTPADAEAWFGKAPPDLSLIARAKASGAGSGADYLYTYLRSFYKDKTRPTGWNNKAFDNIGMPHAMWDLQGEATAEVTFDKNNVKNVKLVAPAVPGSMSAEKYDDAVADLVSFLVWMGEPVAGTRKTIGIFVLIFLAGFYVLTHMLGKTYWKNIH